jgi:hypothetical protein
VPPKTTSGDIKIALAAAGIPLSSGYLAAQIDKPIKISLAGEDNSIRWQGFNSTYTNYVTGTTFEWGPGASEDYCGLLFREPDDKNFYTIQINRDGNLWFNTHINDVWSDNIDGNGDAIHTGAKETNQLLLIVNGGTFTVYINGKLASTFKDATLSNGLVNVMSGTYDKSDQSGCNFTDFWLWSQDATPTPGPTPEVEATSTEAIDPQIVSDALAKADIKASDGFVASSISQKAIDNSGKDNWLQWERFEGEYGDFAAGTTIQWGPGATDDYCGFVFREVDGDNLYAAQINRDGKLFFSLKIKGAWKDDVNSDGKAIRKGRNDRNQLMVVAQGDTFKVYINGQFGGELTDKANAKGKIGLLAGTYEKSDKSGCTFTNGWVWTEGKPEAQATLPTTPSGGLPTSTPSDDGVSFNPGGVVLNFTRKMMGI